ncbi:OLC1v1011185C1 [Oldenlandia corymbosa var. corymbosa]|uniref:CASP-like protein n=1 Tax=Oldenlandia corymbosa var. corymbosa TaxID=529605 RepID=A0AAV1DT48_OLDCO|nr:OLC1v1011185C1 [Oldenlandia corymbosa var. corymbosa]
MERDRKQSASSEKEDYSVGSLDNSEDFKLHPLSEKSAGYSPEGSSISSHLTSHESSPSFSKEEQATPNYSQEEQATPPVKSASKTPEPVPVVNRFVTEEPPSLEKKADAGRHVGSVEEGGRVGESRRSFRPSLTSLRRTKREQLVKKTALGFRVFGFLFSLVSLSVMASDRNQGWAIDSYDRYKEFRYCFAVSMIVFVYSAAQALDLGYQLITGSSILQGHHYRYFFDFAFDQMIAYLLISASSSAATRVEDWVLNWGKDKFPEMASIAVSMSFLAFAAIASNSLLSGYSLCTSMST